MDILKGKSYVVTGEYNMDGVVRSNPDYSSQAVLEALV